MSDNPYQAPDAELHKEASLGEFKLGQPKSVDVGRGWGWIADGFGYFKKSPGAWIGATVVWMIIMMVLNFVPLLGQLGFMLTMYVWIAGFMVGCREQDKGHAFQFNHLFAGFSNNVGKLILLSVIAAAVSMAVMFATMGSLYFSILTGDPAAGQEMMNNFNGFMLSMLFAMLIMIPLIMAIWFAPALIVLENVSIVDALKLSFKGCLKNMLPFLLFGIIGVVLYILAMIPIFLGLLVVIPTLMASMYVAYKDIYIES